MPRFLIVSVFAAFIAIDMFAVTAICTGNAQMAWGVIVPAAYIAGCVVGNLTDIA